MRTFRRLYLATHKSVCDDVTFLRYFMAQTGCTVKQAVRSVMQLTLRQYCYERKGQFV